MEARLMHEDPRTIFGANVRRRRELVGLSQEDLSELCELHRTYIGAIERGERNLGLINIVRIADALSVAPSEFLQGIGTVTTENHET